MQRRTFIQNTCLACLMVGTGGLLLESCKTSLPMMKTTAIDQTVLVPLEKFTTGNNMLIVRAGGALEYDILLVKKPEGYKALYLRCTHEGFGLTPTGKHIVCSAHGSTFNFDGQVTKEPALLPLREFRTEQKNSDLVIHLT